MQTFVEWEVCICYTEVFSASEKLDAQTIPNLWLSQLYSDFVLETGRDSTLFSGLRFIFLDVTFGWRFSQERHFDDATAQASHFFQQAFVVCVWISNTSLVEHAGDTRQCATMNLCVQEYLERYFSLCAGWSLSIPIWHLKIWLPMQEAPADPSYGSFAGKGVDLQQQAANAANLLQARSERLNVCCTANRQVERK